MSVNRTPTQPSCTYDRPVIVLYVIFRYAFLKQIELFFSLIISYSPALHKQNIFRYNKKALTNVSAFFLEVTPGFEPGNQGFADPCLTTWLCHHFEKDALTSASFSFGADDEARTRYLHLGKVALYQMSYGRILQFLYPETAKQVVPPIGIEPMTRGFSVPCSTN